MSNIFDQITIRRLLSIYFIISIIVPFIFVSIKPDKHTAYLLQNIILLLCLGLMLIDNVKLADIYKDFSQKIVAEEKMLLRLFIVMLFLDMGVIELLVYIIDQIDPQLLKKLVAEAIQDDKTSSNLSEVSLNLNSSLIAPIVEEIMFRGIILNRLSKRWGFNVGIIVSSLLFAIMHLKMAMIGAFVVGIIMSLIYLKTNNIMIPMTLHIINNSFVTIEELVMSFIEDDSSDLIVSSNDLMIGVVLFLPSLFYIVQYMKQNWPSKTIKVESVDLNNPLTPVD